MSMVEIESPQGFSTLQRPGQITRNPLALAHRQSPHVTGQTLAMEGHDEDKANGHEGIKVVCAVGALDEGERRDFDRDAFDSLLAKWLIRAYRRHPEPVEKEEPCLK